MVKLSFIGKFPDQQQIIAIIGPRKPTAPSSPAKILQHQRDTNFAYELARQAARKGMVVLSGLASGIDTAAHLGCLNEGGLTVAVVPFGLGAQVYPPENLQLYNRIIDQGGCIVSQFKTEQQAVKWTFVARDKTQALLAEKIIVVGTFEPEGIITGGTKHCARWARKLDKPLYHYREIAGQYTLFNDQSVQIEP